MEPDYILYIGLARFFLSLPFNNTSIYPTLLFPRDKKGLEDLEMLKVNKKAMINTAEKEVK